MHDQKHVFCSALCCLLQVYTMYKYNVFGMCTIHTCAVKKGKMRDAIMSWRLHTSSDIRTYDLWIRTDYVMPLRCLRHETTRDPAYLVDHNQVQKHSLWLLLLQLILHCSTNLIYPNVTFITKRTWTSLYHIMFCCNNRYISLWQSYNTIDYQFCNSILYHYLAANCVYLQTIIIRTLYCFLWNLMWLFCWVSNCGYLQRVMWTVFVLFAS